MESADPSQMMPGVGNVLEGQPVFLESPAGTLAIIAADAVSKPLDMVSLLASVAEVRAKTDLLIVSLHWGVEYAGEPTPLQRDQAGQLANAGVDVLWGHHPHVLQPAEWVDSEDGSHRMLALYSLGNLLTDQIMTYETRHSALVQLRVRGGEISQLSLQPLVLTQMGGSWRWLILMKRGKAYRRTSWLGRAQESFP
jgi:poly-gamma-glutamate capsule biosynthesis protein CapA/YwtB (metallophosphatase superfamily)